eukprot:g17237.t1
MGWGQSAEAGHPLVAALLSETSLYAYLQAVAAVGGFLVLASYTAYSYRWVSSLLYMVCSSDTKGLKKDEEKASAAPCNVLRQRTIYFLRHGESEWNWVFNKKPVILAPFRLIFAAISEVLLGGQDSIFLDSPLNDEGLKQASEMSTVAEALVPRGAVFVTSPLRRAITTLLLAFKNRVKSKHVPVWHCLQEISRNVDTAAFTPAHSIPVASKKLQKHDPFAACLYDRVLDVSGYEGNKTLRRRGLSRLREFATKVFPEKSTGGNYQPPLVVGGHSLWFKNFFNLHLAANVSNEKYPLAGLARTKKIHNGGLVKFSLQECESLSGHKLFYRIDPASITEVHKGFEGSGFDGGKKSQ